MSANEVAAAARTPPQEEPQNGSYASYVPHDLPYDDEFENALMRVVNNPDHPHDGVRIIPEGSNEIPVEGVSVKADAISPQSLPSITESELPLRLTDERRVFASPVPGVKLTHPGGYLEGGPGLDPEMDTFAEDFFARHPEITDAANFQAAVAKEIEHHRNDLRERMQKRQSAIEHNERVERELQTMQDNHRLELQVHKKLAHQKRAKREAKEKRKMEKENPAG